MTDQKQPVPLVGVSILVMKEHQVLLIKRAHVHGEGTWAPPGGHLNFGETFEQCAIRETKEETGVDIRDVTFKVITNDVFTNEQKHYITIWVEAHYAGGEVRLAAPYEESEVGWFSVYDLPHPLFLPLQHLLAGKTFPALTEIPAIAPVIFTHHKDVSGKL